MGEVTEEQIQEVLDEMMIQREDDQFGFHVFFHSQEAADKWFKDLNEEMKKQFYENYDRPV